MAVAVFVAVAAVEAAFTDATAVQVVLVGAVVVAASLALPAVAKSVAVPAAAASVPVLSVAVSMAGLALTVPVEHGDAVGFEAEVAG